MNIAHLLTDTITVQAEGGVTGAGDPTWGAQVSRRARVEFRSQLVIDATGTEKRSDTVVVTDVEVPLTSRIWLPGENTGNTAVAHRPITVAKASTPGGYTVFETYL